jgi:hypothetical protein
MTLPQGVTSNPVTVGSVGATAIIAELGNGLYPDRTVTVTLSGNYLLARPPGYPLRPWETATNKVYTNGTVPSGTTLAFYKPEADALIAAGFATLVGSD